MQFPPEFTAQDIMEFEYEWGRWCDEVDQTGQWWAVNAELQQISQFANSEWSQQ